jgi:ankyrin repeat protein
MTHSNRNRNILGASLMAAFLATAAAPEILAGPKEASMSRKEEFLKAVEKGKPAQVKAMLQKEPTLAAVKNADGVSAVLLACYYRHKEVAAELLATGIELNVFEASATGRTERVKVLLKKDPGLASAYATDGFTPLGLAAFFGHKLVAEALLAGGAKVNQASRNKEKVLPLHSAVAAQQADIVRLLIDHGADVKACQTAGITPLHQAAASGQLDMARLLLSHGADIKAKMEDGKTPRDLAVDRKQARVAEFLLKQGG